MTEEKQDDTPLIKVLDGCVQMICAIIPWLAIREILFQGDPSIATAITTWLMK